MKKQKTKKNFILLSLFTGPLLFYFFLSLGIYRHANLPILTHRVEELEGTERFQDHFTVVGFLGKNTDTKTGIFNLNEVIYKRFRENLYFQCLLIAPKGLEEEVKNIQEKLASHTRTDRWKFVFMPTAKIAKLFDSFQSPYQLDADGGSEYVFIIDRKVRLRGRKDDPDTIDGKLYGYNTNLVADLKNKMRKDLEVLYYQLKKSLEKEKRRKQNI